METNFNTPELPVLRSESLAYAAGAQLSSRNFKAQRKCLAGVSKHNEVKLAQTAEAVRRGLRVQETETESVLMRP